MRRKPSRAAKAATTSPPDARFPLDKPLDLSDFAPDPSRPDSWAMTAYKDIPAMSRDELLEELKRMDTDILPAAEWVAIVSLVPPYSSLTATGDPFASIRDLVRLRAILPRLRFWLELGPPGSSPLAATAPADLSAYASHLAGLIMMIDGEAWRVATWQSCRSWASRSDDAWKQAADDFRAELERRLRDAFLHCLMQAVAATAQGQASSRSDASHPADSDGATRTVEPEAPAEC